MIEAADPLVKYEKGRYCQRIRRVTPKESSMRARTPQQKKRNSLRKDRRNVYGESPHGARKAIAKNKRIRIRVERHAATVAVSAREDESALDLANTRAQLKRKKAWKKQPDAPLAEVIESNIDRRRRLLANPRKRKAQPPGTPSASPRAHTQKASQPLIKPRLHPQSIQKR